MVYLKKLNIKTYRLKKINPIMLKYIVIAEVAELADAPGSGSGSCKAVRVRLPPSAL